MMRNFHPDVLVAAVPNGGARRKREAAALKAEGVLPGFPDLVVMEPSGGYHGCVVEMKSLRGKVSDKQVDVLERLRRKGYYALVAYGADDALKKVESYLAMPREEDWIRWQILT
jgi:hypothetical protein